MANKTIAQLDSISGAIDNATDLAIMYDTSATKTVKTTIQNLLTTQLSGLNTSGKNVVSAINEVYASITQTISEIASEESSPATANHNPGELILYNDGLYRTTSYIVIGESLTDSGDSANIESITISECMEELWGVKNLVGSETMGTEASSITGAIAQHEGDINEINGIIGSETMGTDATTVTGAIAEHESDITSINSNFAYKIFEVNNISYDTGTIGTRAWQTYFDISLAGYNVLSYGLFYISNSNAADFVPFIGNGDSYPNRLYVNAYRGTTLAYSDLSIKIKVVYTKLPITALT